MSERFVMNGDVFEKAINALDTKQNLQNLGQKENKKQLVDALYATDHFKTLMRDSSLKDQLRPYIEELAKYVTFQRVAKGHIMYHEKETVSNLFFVLKGCFVEFKLKSEQDIMQQIYLNSTNGGESNTKQQQMKKDQYYQQQMNSKTKVVQFSDDYRSQSDEDFEQLLKIENKFRDRYFNDDNCLYKIRQKFTAGMNFGELPSGMIKEGNQSRGTIVCAEKAFLLIISCKEYQRIFESLTERVNFIFSVLSGIFLSSKKVILHDFAFNFQEKRLEFNQELYREGDLCTHLYILKTGQLDYRKLQFTIKGEKIEKRIGSVNQGELFGLEDIFNNVHQYSVQSSAKGSLIYQIRKDSILIYQFISTLKHASKVKSDQLKNLLLQNGQHNHDIIHNQDDKMEGKALDSQPQSKIDILNVSIDRIQNQTKFSQNSTTMMQSIPSSLSLNFQKNIISTSQNKSPLKKALLSNNISSQIKLKSSNNIFLKIKNSNFGETDYEILVPTINTQNIKTDEQQQVINPITVRNNMLNKKIRAIKVISPSFTTRAQPQCIYSRIMQQEEKAENPENQESPSSLTNKDLHNKKEHLIQFSSGNSSLHHTLKNPESTIRRVVLSSKQCHFNKKVAQTNTFILDSNTLIPDQKTNKINIDKKTSSSDITKQLLDKNSIENCKANLVGSKINQFCSDIQPDKTQQKILKESEQLLKVSSTSSSSIKRYKELTKEYFNQDSPDINVDFFNQFQNYRKDIQTKLNLDLKKNIEDKSDPLFNINCQLVSTPSSVNNQTTNICSIPGPSNFNFNNLQELNSLKISQNNQLFQPTNSLSRISKYFVRKPQKEQRNLVKTCSEKKKGILNSYNSTTVDPNNNSFLRNTSQNKILNYNPLNIITPLENIIYSSYSHVQNSPRKQELNSSSNFITRRRLSNSNPPNIDVSLIPDSTKNQDLNTQRKICFSNIDCINSYTSNGKITNQNQTQPICVLSSQNRRGSNQKLEVGNVPFQIRENPDILIVKVKSTLKGAESSPVGQSVNVSPVRINNLVISNQESEQNIINNYQNTLSFSNLRQGNGLRLGAQTTLCGKRDIKINKQYYS